MEEEENNMEEIDYKMDSKKEGNSKNSPENIDKRKTVKFKSIKTKIEHEHENPLSKRKTTHKQNKIQQQKIKKNKIMSFYFYKENIVFAIKIFLILICFISYFILSYIMYNYY